MTEHIPVEDIRPISYFDELEEQGIYDYDFISGYAAKQEDGSVLIVFGKELPA